MSVIRMNNQNTRRGVGSIRGQQGQTIRESDEFEGFWLNVGLMNPDGTFSRLNRGIAVSDLQVRQIYETTDPARADELNKTNAMVRSIKAKANAKNLAEGEYIVIRNVAVVLYRRMEGTEGTSTATVDAQMEDFLFGEETQESAEDVEALKAELAALKASKASAGSKRKLDIENDD